MEKFYSFPRMEEYDFMNFSKNATSKKLSQLKSASKRLSSKFNINMFRIFLFSVLAIIIVGCSALFGAVNGLIATAPSLELINVVPSGYASTIYYNDGTVSETLAGIEANRVYLTIDQLPKIVQDTFVAVEDERFYEHDGIDMRGIIRAAVSVLKTGGLDYGASTITQQLLKNQVLGGGKENNPFDKISRKIQEQYLAIQLENQLSKSTILEYYINTVNFGSTAYGIQTAAQIYFGKDAADLTLSEAAVLAAIPYSPTYMNPIHYPEDNAKRRKEGVLDNMLKNGFCTQAEYDEALADDPYSRIQTISQEKNETSYYSYFTDAAIEQVQKDLIEKKGYTQAQASSLIYSGGLHIFTTQDKHIQEICDEVYLDESMYPDFGDGSLYELSYALSVQKADGTTIHHQLIDFLNYFNHFKGNSSVVVQLKQGVYRLLFSNLEYMVGCLDEFYNAQVEEGDIILGEKRTITPQPQSSFVIMDHKTGEVIAMVGGRGEKIGNRTLNRATSSVRAVGSTFKVLASFLPALDTAGMTLATPIDDIPYYYPGTSKEVINWWAKGSKANFNGPFYGLNTIRRGISYSMNVIAVRTLEMVTPQVAFDYLKKLGFTTLVESRTDEATGRTYSDINLSLALGGLTDGVTNLEMTAAYATIANNGIYNQPHLYTKVLDHDGRVLLSNEPDSTQVIKTSTAYLLTSAMIDTVTGGSGFATGSNLKFKEYKMPVAGKTGTSSDNNDLWFCGYTPYYTASIWSGYDNNYPQKNQSYQQHMWRTIMERIHAEKELPYVEFEIPDSVVTARICTKSGKLAVDGVCNHAQGGSTVKIEYFAKGTIPTEKCNIHIKASVCKDSNALASEYCPAESLTEKIYLTKDEPEVLDWNGKTVYYSTSDTPYILPTGEKAVLCPLHTSAPVVPDIQDEQTEPTPETGSEIIPPSEDEEPTEE